jgi:hypothetical protein
MQNVIQNLRSAISGISMVQKAVLVALIMAACLMSGLVSPVVIGVAMVVGIVACVGNLAMQFVPRNIAGAAVAILTFVFALAWMASTGFCGTDATAITTAGSAAFADIATLCVSIGTFFVVYRLAKRVK